MIEHLPTQAIEFDEVAIFYNTESTNGDATLDYVKNRLERVKKQISIQYFPTSVVESEMLDIYGNSINPSVNTIVGIVGGDGTINHVNKTKTALAEDYPSTALWAVAGGSGQNLLRSSIDKLYWSRPDIALELGRIIGFKTLVLDTEGPDGDKRSFEAVSAVGFNGTPHMIKGVNEESHREKWARNLHIGHYAIGKYLADPPEIFNGLLESPSSFKYLNERDEEVSAFEILFVNTPRVAGIVNAPEVKLSGPAHRVEVKRKIDLPLTFVKVRLGLSPGKDLIEPSIIRPLEDVTIQIDGDTKDNGEPLHILAGSTVTVSQSEDTVGLLELNLAA